MPACRPKEVELLSLEGAQLSFRFRGWTQKVGRLSGDEFEAAIVGFFRELVELRAA